jgi:hypothetical protein
MEYIWNVVELVSIVSENGLTNVVKTAHYTVYLTDGDYSVNGYGSVDFDSPDSATFKPYEELTLDEVILWVKQKVNYQAIEYNLLEELNKKKNPITVINPLPWE